MRTQVIDYRCRIEVGAVTVKPGDLVFGDVDGVLIIPRAVEHEVIEQALEKARGEKDVGKEEIQKMIDDGEPIEVNCHFCNSHYTFTVDELKKMYDCCIR